MIQLMDDYYLTKEDWDVVMDFMIGPDKTDTIIKKIPTAVKSSFTRKYNSMTHPVAIYKTGSSIGSGSSGGSSSSMSQPDFEDIVDADITNVTPDDDNNNENDTELDLKKDKLIKQKTRTTKKKATSAEKSAAKRRSTKV